MGEYGFRRERAFSLAAALVGWSFVGPRLPTPWRVTAQAGAATLLVLATRAPLGLSPPRLWAGLRLGSAAGAAAASAIAATTAVPLVRASMADREPPGSMPGWLLLQIPVGTVWAEEAAFRAALTTAASGAYGNSGGRVLQAASFGLSHIADARAAGEPVVGTVLVTGIAGWLFSWLAERSGSLAAPMLVHLAINEAGAIAALRVRRQGLMV
ncbi:CPBP family intramembrane glutamic endopeptidase [Mycobacterium nebraskense]|uniref:Abortive phage infection protein n=1 Tax=Mycobacterium nebraskense TaxID=244292 RepID=A0A1X1ZJ18_9MYCO|nr:CPBP family intramembrane glutamic endopeptidase [Mycobacterium nebraskense]MBI2696539.1 CPBP family intramembrane metalloprotease [Mycobacterium nebraskense]MCV7117292.1 CPBP family intramembrane metalloprotease [Mycobacterium nebraskense]ORW23364.1 abortive phage infection protein [Mycobacterium nebraskense]